MGAHGVAFGKPSVDLDKLRGWKDGVVKRLTGGLTTLARQRKVTVVTGEAQVHLAPTRSPWRRRRAAAIVRFAKAIIAAGSEPVAPGFIPKDPRIWDSTGALDLGFIAEAHAGARRRHHRAGDGDGLRGAGLRRSPSSR